MTLIYIQSFLPIQYRKYQLSSHSTMVAESPPYDYMLDGEYIVMDVSSSRFFYYNTGSPLHSRDFEFHLPTNQVEKEPTPSPADELFYKGKLLPLHLPPRMQMVEKLLNISSGGDVHTPVIPPLKVADKELSSEGYQNAHAMLKKTWAKKLKLKLIRQSTLGLKFKASRAYIKSLFAKSPCQDESSGLTKGKESCKNGTLVHVRRERHLFDKATSGEENSPSRNSISSSATMNSVHSYSFYSSSSSCTSSSSLSCSSFQLGNRGQQILTRSSSMKSEAESSIQGAIAHCKDSLQKVSARKSLSDIGRCSLSVARIAAACDGNDWTCLCTR